ncbi:MAG: OST-HTH/LOTUS domain-containing protein [Bacteroidetes bacterium]|nr:OST-HTH/LOTUS domain-containing protein [Bacteroidota bacterium]
MSTEPDPTAALTDKSLRKLVLSTIEDFADEQGWLPMAALGNSILKKRPEFDARNYGFKRLSDLVKALPYVDVEERQTGSGNKHDFVRWK